MHIKFLFGVVVVLLSGCANYPYSGRSSSLHDYDVVVHQTQVISNPPGARIEVDGDYLGDAPLIIQWPGFRNGIFNASHTVIAYPIYSGQYVQRKYYEKYKPVPASMFFDMRLN